jgi:ribosomal protein L11 methyltransferase
MERLEKLVIDGLDRDEARTCIAALETAFAPEPMALSDFESGSGWRIDAYYEADADLEAIAKGLAALLAPSHPRIGREAVPELNWVAVSQAALPPVVAGRFTVHGSHDRHRLARGPLSIEIDAGEAFGTAHHATTHGCLRAIDRLTRRRRFRRVLDLGCGTGVLAIAAARALPNARIAASDIDPEAARITRQNARINGTAHRIQVQVADGLARAGPAYDLIVANILAGPLIEMAAATRRRLARGGRLVLSGILVGQAPAVIAAYRASSMALERHDRLAGWSTLILVSR